jgi:endoglucanase
VVGQDGPSANDLAKTWAQIAAYYKSQPRVVFGTMNEPHDSGAVDANNNPIIDFNMDIWAATLQTVVNAIRNAGATSQMIFISPSNYANAGSFPDRSKAILTVKDPSDSSNKNLIFELHQYFDSHGGKYKYCDQDLVQNFEQLAGFLKQHKRQAFMGELGGGSNPNCTDAICGVLDVLNQNSDVFLGWTSWAAGNLWPDYELTELPTANGGDVGLVEYCFAPKFKASQ